MVPYPGPRLFSGRTGVYRAGMALQQAIAQRGELSRPPHLRTGTPPKVCASCMYFRPKSLRAGKCRLYGGYPVDAGDVCDSYKAKGS